MNFLRNKYWLIRGRQSIKSLLQKCATCKYLNAKTVIPPTTPALPKFRLDYSFPYQDIGLDYVGPIYFKNCDHIEKMVKGYFLIITCCCTCIIAFRRFISSCGIPENIINHNFKTFKAVKLQSFMRYLRIKWDFILEKFPWWAGFYERMTRSINNALKKVVGISLLDYEQLNAVLVEV